MTALTAAIASSGIRIDPTVLGTCGSARAAAIMRLGTDLGLVRLAHVISHGTALSVAEAEEVFLLAWANLVSMRVQ